MSNFKLGFVELYWPKIHGTLEKKDEFIHYHYIVTELFSTRGSHSLKDSFYNKRQIEAIPLFYTNNYKKYTEMQNNNWPVVSKYPNSYISNFECIVSENNYFQYHIVKPYLLDSYHSIAVIKTYFIRIIQRVWKKFYNKRKIFYNERNKLSNIHFKNTHGEWPESCRIIPSARGILNNI